MPKQVSLSLKKYEALLVVDFKAENHAQSYMLKSWYFVII